MRKIITLFAIGVLFSSCKNEEKKAEASLENEQMTATSSEDTDTIAANIEVVPVSHATAVIKFDDKVFYIDPVGGKEAFAGMDAPDFVLVTDIHGDHMSAETLQALELDSTKIIVPEAVKDKLPEALQQNLMVMNNGDTEEIEGFSIEAIPMYNLPETNDAMHVKGRGNGYVLEMNDARLYIAGDTEDIPEMRNLRNIDVALVPMNLPYTMPVDQAAEGVLAFKPKRVIPYHFRGKDGFADVEQFKKLVNEGDSSIEVDLLEWYPESEKKS